MTFCLRLETFFLDRVGNDIIVSAPRVCSLPGELVEVATVASSLLALGLLDFESRWESNSLMPWLSSRLTYFMPSGPAELAFLHNLENTWR